MNRQQLEGDLVCELASILGQGIGPDDDLLFEGGLDSFGIMQVVAYLEETYRIRVPEDVFARDNFRNVSTIAAWVLPLER